MNYTLIYHILIKKKFDLVCREKSNSQILCDLNSI